jgi:alpha-beta hydrolase superfamily lysophospholipase
VRYFEDVPVLSHVERAVRGLTSKRLRSRAQPKSVASVDGVAHRHLASDGWELQTFELNPAEPPIAVVVAAHSMMADGGTVVTPRRDHLAAHLMARGLVVLVPDLRGHGASGPTPRQGGDWSYDDIVHDVGEYIALAQRLHPDLPIVLLGHSLSGQSAIAYLGLHPDAPVAACVALGANVWAARWTHGRRRWLEKRASMLAAAVLVRAVGYMPSKRLGFGSADESASYWAALEDSLHHNRWAARDGTDYQAGLGRIRCPVLHVLTAGDILNAVPDDALAFSAALGARREVLCVGSPSGPPGLRHFAPTHMGLVTDPRSAPIWDWVADWIVTRALRSTKEP